jgi:restriction endonuclease Mrr
MANRNEGKQYTFRINFNNPDHLKVYRTLEDLNLKIHKSVSSFVIKAILFYIKSYSEEGITNSGLENKANKEGYVTRQELEEIESRIRMDVIKEVAQMLSDSVLKSQNGMSPEMFQQMMQMMKSQTGNEGSKSGNDSNSEETDAALEEMSLLFASGNFGEE